MHPLRAAEIAWYATGRFYLASDGSVADYGYFLHLAGLPDLFAGKPGETTAHYTFAAKPFTPKPLSNGALSIGMDPVGEFSIYLQRTPLGDFDRPASFAEGECIATLRRLNVVAGVTVESSTAKSAPSLFASNLFSAAIVSSREFEVGGRRYDLRRFLPDGVTQSGVAAGDPVPDPPSGYSASVPFVGSAVAIGAAGLKASDGLHQSKMVVTGIVE